jgi:plasmid stabilization system protein ParE
MSSPDFAVSGRDWYAVLSLSAAASEAEIAAAVERLGRQAAALAVTSPDRSRDLRELARSIKQDLLSGPEARQRYDDRLTALLATAPTPPLGRVDTGPVPSPSSGIARFLRAGWVCPSCGTGALPSDNFCMKCGTRIVPPGRNKLKTADQSKSVAATCATCGGVLAPEDSFCTRCGTNCP